MTAADPDRERLRAEIARRAEDSPTPVAHVSPRTGTILPPPGTPFVAADDLHASLIAAGWQPGELHTIVAYPAEEVPRLLARVAALEAECAAKDDLLSSLWLYMDWRHVTRQLTTEQKLLFADAVDREARRGGEEPTAERWWDWPSCGVCACPVENRDGRWWDLFGYAEQPFPINWAGVGPTPAHAHAPAVVRAELEGQQ